MSSFHLDRERPLVVQVSRFDVFKDPIGVIKSYRMARKHADMQIVLAGGGAADDPEGAAILEQVKILLLTILISTSSSFLLMLTERSMGYSLLQT